MALLFSCLFTDSNAQQRGVSQPWSERGIFVFDGIHFDFWRSLQTFGPISSPLTNCSDEKFFCAESRDFHIVLPRQCRAVENAEVGESWGNGKITLSVLHVARSPEVRLRLHAYGTGTRMLLGNPAYPYVIYEYDPGLGILSFYYDGTRKINFVERGKSNDLEQFKTRVHHFGIALVDPFGACR